MVRDKLYHRETCLLLLDIKSPEWKNKNELFALNPQSPVKLADVALFSQSAVSFVKLLMNLFSMHRDGTSCHDHLNSISVTVRWFLSLHASKDNCLYMLNKMKPLFHKSMIMASRVQTTIILWSCVATHRMKKGVQPFRQLRNWPYSSCIQQKKSYIHNPQTENFSNITLLIESSRFQV